MRLANISVVGCFFVAMMVMEMWPENSGLGGPERALAKIQDRSSSRLSSGEGGFIKLFAQRSCVDKLLKVNGI